MTTDLRNLSIAELKKIKKEEKQKLEKEYRQKLIDDIKKIRKVRYKLNPNPNPNPLKSKHLKSIFRIVSKIKQFHLIHHLICAKHLRELLGNMTKE